MGADPTRTRAPVLHDSNGGRFSVEFSVVAILSFGSRHLRGRSAANQPAVSGGGCRFACPRCFDRCRYADVAGRRVVRFSADLDFYRTCCDLVFLGIFVTRFRISAVDACIHYICGAARHLSLHPAKLRCSEI